MSSKIRVIEYDVRGQICPSCLLIALREVNRYQQQIKSGEVVFQILSDNRQSTATIPNAVLNMGYRVEVTKENGGYYNISISSGE